MAGSEMSSEFAAAVAQSLEGKGFLTYRDAELPGRAELERGVLELIERAARLGAPDDAARRLLGEVVEQMAAETTRERLFDGVSHARLHRDRSWEEHEAELFARSTGVGAVHLELGTWSAWPASRQAALADEYGLAEVIRLDFEPTYELDVVGDAQVLPFADGSIDRISADSVLEHLAHPHHVIRECHRVLRPGGVMRLATPWTFALHWLSRRLPALLAVVL